ncbi:MAG: OsmC family protein [Candidatus Obscuribacterales bacterium]|nr:OsmC family protein [Candidatus Obscuribacterales bacterium]
MSTVSITMAESGKPYQLTVSARTHTINLDAPLTVPGVKTGGGDTAMTPHELFLAAPAGCIAMTVWMYAMDRQWPLEKINISVEEDKIDDPDGEKDAKGVINKIPHIKIKITPIGKLTDEQKKRLETVAASCPVYKLLTGKKVVAKEFVFEDGTKPAEAETKT